MHKTASATDTLWKGSFAELNVLLEVLARHCTCTTAPLRGYGCATHSILFDQRAVDGLVFARHIAERLLVEEFMHPLSETSSGESHLPGVQTSPEPQLHSTSG